MKKKLALVLALALTASLSLTACTTSGGSSSGSGSGSGSGSNAGTETVTGGKEGGTSLTFTTGGDQGTYFGFGGVLAGKVGEATSTQVTVISSGGSQANIENMEIGDAQLGFVQSDVMAYAYQGIRNFDGAAVTDFSTVASLYMEQVQIVTLDPEIKTVADLKGKRVSIGAPGSGVYYNAIDVLAAYDMTENDIQATLEDFGTSAESLQDGKDRRRFRGCRRSHHRHHLPGHHQGRVSG